MGNISEVDKKMKSLFLDIYKLIVGGSIFFGYIFIISGIAFLVLQPLGSKIIVSITTAIFIILSSGFIADKLTLWYFETVKGGERNAKDKDGQKGRTVSRTKKD